MSKRHRVFISYHHQNDQGYRERFESLFASRAETIISGSVNDGDINPNLSADRVRQIIRDQYLRDTTVTVVLIGKDTWARKHVDWEISSSIRNTQYNPRSGLIGILLPSHSNFRTGRYTPNLVPPRLNDNVACGFSKIFDWSESATEVQDWIHEAFLNRTKVLPNNQYQSFSNNRSTKDNFY